MEIITFVAEGYPYRPNKDDKNTYTNFFKTIQHVLPCIYCRRSFKQYIQELPIEPYLKNKRLLVKWLYLMHNKVNDKLRKQGLNSNPDPTFTEVCARYKQFVKDINKSNCIGMPGWDFLYCIVFNFPLHKSDIETERYYQHIIFFKYLGKVLPFKSVKEKYKNIIKTTNFLNVLKGRENFKKWFYKLEKDTKKIISCKCLK